MATATSSLATRPRERGGEKRHGSRPWRRLLPIYLLILPGMALFLIWTLYPLLDALVMSFFRWNPNPAATSQFIGIKNYQRALTDPVFWHAFLNIIIYTVTTIIGQMVLGLGIALLLNRALPGRGIFRALYYLPVITSWVVASFLTAYIFSTPSGPVNWFFGDVLHLIPDSQAWLGSTSLALPTLIILGIWKGIGWNMVVFLAGLQNISTDLYEAGRTDGANSRQLFRSITLPLLRPVITFASVVLMIASFGTFIQVFILTQGGPLHSTETLMTYAYTNAFQTFDFGYAAAITYIFAVFVFLLALVQIWLQSRNSAAR